MYSTIVKILFLNSMLGGFPLYLLEKLFSHLVISVAWNGTKYVIKEIGNYIFSEPIEINISNNENNESREQQETMLEQSILNIHYNN
jgi:hypothetical protein